MKLLAFVIWIIGWPALFLQGYKPGALLPDNVVVFFLAMWIWIGVLIYRKV